MNRSVRMAAVFVASSISTTAWAQCISATVSLEIDAPYDVVFDTIVDGASYPDWNPYVIDIDPIDVDLTVVGSTFDLYVYQPFLGVVTVSEEVVTQVDLPDDGYANLTYDFAGELAPLLGFPSRNQTVTAIDCNTSLYETNETFCGPLIAFVPVADVQEGFRLQADALAAESIARYEAQCSEHGHHDECGEGPGNGHGNGYGHGEDGPGRNGQGHGYGHDGCH